MSRALSALLLVALAVACGGAPPADARRAVLAGVVLDRATGVPVKGARVLLPDGRETRTDTAGRFLLRDLEPGLEGELLVRTEDGREGRNALRRLPPRRLEVVVYAGP
ncbi:MAG: carboxypeptidase regulatory-like domain-containing protein [Planctomycetes bacterium]|nr:carboxypeptidase regulatory-like domain-containing protein [Planctomycetota bacterium]